MAADEHRELLVEDHLAGPARSSVGGATSSVASSAARRASGGSNGYLVVRRLLAVVGALGASAGATLGLASLGGPGGHGAGLQKLSPAGVISRYDPLSTVVAGMPGMPVGRDEDTSYLNTAPRKAPASFYTASHEPPTPRQLCGSDEELYLGMCYKQCKILTEGTHPFRVSPYNCCKQDFSLTCVLPSEQKFNFGTPGSGYDVAGDGGVPHPPGICDFNEEDHLNVCYKKCSLLTQGTYPFRAAANTCCKGKPCWNIFNLRTSGSWCNGYGVGGGLFGHDCPHPPIEPRPLPTQVGPGSTKAAASATPFR